MKNLFHLLAISIFFVILAGCEKDPTYTVQITTTEGGTVEPSGTIKVDEGSNLIITATPDAGYKLLYFLVDSAITNNNGVQQETENTLMTLENVVKDHNVEVIFADFMSWDVMQVVWKLDSTYIHELNGTWSYYKIWGVPGETQETVKFLPNGYTACTTNGDTTFSFGKWRIDETKTPPELHLGMNAAVPEGFIYILEGDLKTSLILARYNEPYLDDPSKKGDYKFVYTPLK